MVQALDEMKIATASVSLDVSLALIVAGVAVCIQVMAEVHAKNKDGLKMPAECARSTVFLILKWICDIRNCGCCSHGVR